MLIYACIFNSQIFVLMCLKTYSKYCYKGGLQSCGPQGLNISGKWAKHFGPHPLSLSPLSCCSPGCFSPGPTCCLLKTIGSPPKKAVVLSSITDSLKSQYFIRLELGRQIQSAVRNVNSIIFYTIFY